MATLHIGEALRRYTDGKADFEWPASTCGELLECLFREHPDVRTRVVDDSAQLRRHLALFVDGQAVRAEEALDEPLGADSEVEIIAAMAGG